AKRVRLLKLAEHWPHCPDGGDVSDWLDAGEDGDWQWHFLQPDDVVEPTGQSLPVEVPIRAVLTGTRQCAAPTLDLSVNAYTPVLTLARQLLRTGSHPDRLIEVYRGTTLCFRVSLATTARLTVK